MNASLPASAADPTCGPQEDNLRVALPGREVAYPIYIATGLLPQVGQVLLGHLRPGAHILRLSDPTVETLYGQPVDDALRAAGFNVHRYVVPEGETAKTWQVAEGVLQEAQRLGFSRRDAMLALGGGVTGDLTGFCAALYYRGVEFIQVPTTLLAQVDASVGGKVAINFQHAKNGLGTFYQPRAVVIDPATLATLSERQQRAGWAEVLKTAMLERAAFPEAAPQPGAPTLWERLTSLLADDTGLPAPQHMALPGLLAQCCTIKAAVVAQDETEQTGLRALLNLGHTFAHALESGCDYTGVLHGEAVGLGLRWASRVSQQLGWLAAHELAQVEAMADRLGLWTHWPPDLPGHPDLWLARMRQDKKTSDGQLTLILPCSPLGEAKQTTDAPEAAVRRVMQARG
jgi:3-dehydroquinate synthase